MKLFNYSVLLLTGLTAACHSSANKQNTNVKEEKMNGTGVHASAQLKHTADPAKTADSALLLIPGKQAGNIYLGQDMKAVTGLLGRPDDGDAAMGSALGIWYNHTEKDTVKKNPLVIFSSYCDSNMVVKDVKQISVSAPDFSTAQGIHTGIALAKLKEVYPAIKKAETYTSNKAKDTLTVYDLKDRGIAFDIQKGICTAITIHQQNRAVNGVYLTIHPAWKKVQ